MSKGYILVAELSQNYKSAGYTFISHDDYIEINHKIHGSLKLSEDEFLRWLFNEDNLKEIGVSIVKGTG